MNAAGGAELIEQLKKDEFLTKSKDAVEALEDLDILFKYCAIFSMNDKVCIGNVQNTFTFMS